MITLKFSRSAKVTRALTGRRPVRPAADDDLQIYLVDKINIHHLLCVNSTLSCSKQFLSNLTCILDAAGRLILSSDNPIDFHLEMLLLLAFF